MDNKKSKGGALALEADAAKCAKFSAFLIK